MKFYQCKTAEEILACASDADGLICQRVAITRFVMQNLSRCRVVGRYGIGLDNIDVQAATELGVAIVHTPYFCISEVADHAMGMILCLTRCIMKLDAQVKRDLSGKTARYDNRILLLRTVERTSRQTLGIVGLGKIGTALAKRASAFGFTIVAFDPYLPAEIMEIQGVRKVSYEELLSISDVVSFHTPLTEETRCMLNVETLGVMKSTAYVVNTSRGGVIEEGALIEALQTGRLSGAGLDVTVEEPLPEDHPFLRMDQVILTPHVAFYSGASIENLKRGITESVISALIGGREYSCANPDFALRTRS
jgi:D-3-phosphoglycerate dehydrogenase